MSNHDEDDDNESSFADKTSIMPSDTFKLRLAQAGQAPPAFVMLVGPQSSIGRQWPIEESEKIIGRAPTSFIFVDDRSVSKSHVKIVLSAGDVSIVDLESTNKTIVNGKVLEPLVPYKLKNNDQVKMGNIILKFLERGSIETVATAQSFDRGLKDALTGIANRGAFQARAEESFKRSNLLAIPLSLLIFDLDKFKSINDNYGHPAGDYVLSELAHVVRDKLIRSNDFFARVGGEEFALLLLGSNLAQGQEIGERIRTTIQNHNFVFEDKKLPVTISLGLSTKGEADSEWQSLYERADKALYQSKNNGRNQLTVETI